MRPASNQERFSNFATDLQHSLQQAVSTDSGRYQQASVLAFDWSNDDIGVSGLRDDFLELLRSVYGFNTESYVLNASDSASNIEFDFRDRVIDFTRKHASRNDNATHLLIYYYSGHSDRGPNGDELQLRSVHFSIILYSGLESCVNQSLAAGSKTTETLSGRTSIGIKSLTWPYG